MLRKNVDERLKWKLEDIYQNDSKWEDDYAKLEKLIEETDFSAGKFGHIHPGGAVGERLNGKSLN